MKINWNFLGGGGGGGKTKNLPLGEHGYFLELHILELHVLRNGGSMWNHSILVQDQPIVKT